MDYACIKRIQVAKYNAHDKWNVLILFGPGIAFCTVKE